MKRSIYSIIVFAFALIGLISTFLFFYFIISKPAALTWFETVLTVGASALLLKDLWRMMRR